MSIYSCISGVAVDLCLACGCSISAVRLLTSPCSLRQATHHITEIIGNIQQSIDIKFVNPSEIGIDE